MSSREQFLCGALADLMQVDGRTLSPTANFAELGVDSLLGLRLSRRIQDEVQAEVDLEWLFDYPSIRELSAFLDERFGRVEPVGGSPA